eukprot:11000074-Ditylum_brightwellii.AAC.1
MVNVAKTPWYPVGAARGTFWLESVGGGQMHVGASYIWWLTTAAIMTMQIPQMVPMCCFTVSPSPCI